MARTQEQLGKLANNIDIAQSQIAELEEAVANWKAELAAELGATEKPAVVGTGSVGFHQVTVYQSKQFNAAFAKQNLTAEQITRASKVEAVMTAATAKAGLTEEEYKLTQKPSTNGLSVKVETVEQ